MNSMDPNLSIKGSRYTKFQNRFTIFPTPPTYPTIATKKTLFGVLIPVSLQN